MLITSTLSLLYQMQVGLYFTTYIYITYLVFFHQNFKVHFIAVHSKSFDSLQMCIVICLELIQVIESMNTSPIRSLSRLKQLYDVSDIIKQCTTLIAARHDRVYLIHKLIQIICIANLKK